MLTCLPQSMCSWDYRVRGAEAGDAEITLNFFSEQGTISLGGMKLQVVKQGWLSGKWTLESAAGTYAQAVKPSAMSRALQLDAGGRQFDVVPASTLGRTFDIVTGGEKLGAIRPAHAFTRRAFVECDSSVSEMVQLFAFWLVVLSWRRAASKNA